ncbi:toll/interleukin-1 receptor domain-containing protein [Portibacter marinus]|uniref:toll/interleukin-1 receptor domain-containing protein n=1 Tax=Portibacter marinus TaxID=2898660 RepID=UPI001F208B0A|nr:toll/interleukin-1 receptor domain-containing protein [Portibacter marinus]
MKKLKIFLSYAHEDEAMKSELDKYLISLKRLGKVDVWSDHAIMAGDVWDDNIKHALHEADIILLLISVDFNNSNYIWEQELKVAMERHSQGSARVIPIILKECIWKDFEYSNLQALPDGGVPVSTFQRPEQAYTNIARRITDVVDYMIKLNSLN